MALSSKRLSRDEMGQAAIIHRASLDERLPWLAGLHTPAEDLAFFRDRVFAECEVWGAMCGELDRFHSGWNRSSPLFHAATRPGSRERDSTLGEAALIGFIAFRDGWVDQLYVLPHRQRRGAGGALLQVAKAVSPSLLLWTFQRNAPARRFYEKQGFVAVEETDGSGNEEREPDILYRWQRADAASTERE